MHRLALTAAMAVLSCGPVSGGDTCENTSQTQVPSPDGALRAWVFIRSCGATTLNSVHVSILPASDAVPDQAGNTFVHEPVGGVRVAWPSPREVSIAHDAGGRRGLGPHNGLAHP